MNGGRVAKLQAALLQDPADSFSHYALALEFASGGRPQEAILQLEKLLERDSSYIPAHQQLGYFLQKENRLEEARATFLRGVAEAQRQSDGHSAAEMQQALDEME
jgi:tetratricopeptide (TPR) repeat protein